MGSEAQKQPVGAVAKKPWGRPFVKGGDPRRGRSGGRPATLVEVQAMLDKEHRNAGKMRELFSRLRSLALGEVVEVKFKGQLVGIELQADPRFMDLYLTRVLGPVTNEDKVKEQARALLDAMITEAKERRSAATDTTATEVAPRALGGNGDGG